MPRATTNGKRAPHQRRPVTERGMDDRLDQVLTAAYLQCREEFDSSVDILICTPEQRQRFLELVRAGGADLPESVVLLRLVNLRKRSRLPTRSGDEAELSEV